MKLLYATSIAFPSEMANRVQILSMSSAFSKKLGDGFCLGLSALRGKKVPFRTFETGTGERSFSIAWKYIRLVRREKFTHIYCREERLFFFMKIFAPIFGVRASWIFEIHTVRDDRFLAYAVKHADHAVALTGLIKEDIGKKWQIPAARISVEHDAVDVSSYTREFSPKDRAELRSSLHIPTGSFVVTYVGKYSSKGVHKGVDELIGAVGIARKTEPRIHLLIVGLSLSEMPIVESVCDRSGIPAESRSLIAYVPNSEVPSYVRSGDLLVMNYPNTTHYARYMSPMKLFEYMAARIPILTSDLPSVREVLDDEEAFFVKPDDTAALAAAIIVATRDSEAGKARAAKAFEKVSKEYTWDKRAASILAFIK